MAASIDVNHIRNAPLGTPPPHSGNPHPSHRPPAPNLWQMEGPGTRRTRWAIVWLQLATLAL